MSPARLGFARTPLAAAVLAALNAPSAVLAQEQ